MSLFELEYVDSYGMHAECIEAWDQEAAVQDWRLNHRGELVHLLDVTYVGPAEEVEV